MAKYESALKHGSTSSPSDSMPDKAIGPWEFTAWRNILSVKWPYLPHKQAMNGARFIALKRLLKEKGSDYCASISFTFVHHPSNSCYFSAHSWGTDVPQYNIKHWTLIALNSHKAYRYIFPGYPMSFISTNPYNEQIPHLPLDNHGKQYPELNPDDFSESPTIYSLSYPHHPYSTHYHMDPCFNYMELLYKGGPLPDKFTITQSQHELFQAWFNPIWEQYLGWEHILHALHLDMQIYCPTFAALQHQFDMLYPPELSAKHNADSCALATFCHKAYEIRAWCNYAMFHLVNVFIARMGRPPIHHTVDDDMIGLTLLDIDLLSNLISTLSHHGVPLFQVEVKDIQMMYDP